MSANVIKRPPLQNEAIGRAAYEAFCDHMKAWMPPYPYSADWENQAHTVKSAWVAAALAARDVSESE